MTALPIDSDLAAFITEQAIDLFIENRDVHGYDEARARREAVRGVSEGASASVPDRPSAFPEVVVDPRVPDDEVHLVSGDSRTVIRVGLSEPAEASLGALARAVDCDTAETVRWEIAETLDKCAGTKDRLLAQIQAGEDCDTCPPGFLAVVMQAENLARALDIALDLLKVPAIETPREMTPPWHVRVSRVLDGFTYQTMYVHRFALDDAPRVRACMAQVREQALGHWEEHYGGEHGRVRFHFEWSPDIPDAVVLTAIVPPVGAAVCDPAKRAEAEG